VGDDLRHANVPALGVAHESVSRELGFMAERFVVRVRLPRRAHTDTHTYTCIQRETEREGGREREREREAYTHTNASGVAYNTHAHTTCTHTHAEIKFSRVSALGPLCLVSST